MTKSQAIICDLDNTLAYLNGRNPYDASTCEKDLPNQILISVVKTFYPNYKIIICTGRSEEYSQPTQRWLERNQIPISKMFMRPASDKSTTALKLKEQWLLDKILPGYEVILTFEDNYRTADMYRHYGIPCWQVERDEYLANSYEKMKEKATEKPIILPTSEEISDEDIGFVQRDF